MDWAHILVIILSVFLALFLLLAVILVVLLIKVTRQIKNITTTAERAALNIENVVANVTKVTSPALLAKLIISQVKKFKKKG